MKSPLMNPIIKLKSALSVKSPLLTLLFSLLLIDTTLTVARAFNIIKDSGASIEAGFDMPVPHGPDGKDVLLQGRVNVPKNFDSKTGRVVIIFSGSLPNDVEFTSGPSNGELYKMEQAMAERLAAEGVMVIRVAKRGTRLPYPGAPRAERLVDIEAHKTSTLTERVADGGRIIQFAIQNLNPALMENHLPELNMANLHLLGLSEGGATAIMLGVADRLSGANRVKSVTLIGPAASSMIEVYRWQRYTHVAEQVWENLGLKPNEPMRKEHWPQTAEQWESFLKSPIPGDFMPTTPGDIKDYYDNPDLKRSFAFTWENFARSQDGTEKDRITFEEFAQRIKAQTWDPIETLITQALSHTQLPKEEVLVKWLALGPEQFRDQIQTEVINRIPQDTYTQLETSFKQLHDFENVSFAQYLHWAILGDIGKTFLTRLTVPTLIIQGLPDGNVPTSHLERLFQRMNKSLTQAGQLFRKWTSLFRVIVGKPGNTHRGTDMNAIAENFIRTGQVPAEAQTPSSWTPGVPSQWWKQKRAQSGPAAASRCIDAFSGGR